MKYYIFNIKTNQVRVLDSFDDLIQWCACYNYVTSDGVVRNSLFENIAMNLNDKKVSYRWDSHLNDYIPYLEQREFIVLDENNRIIDIRLYKEEILNCSGISKTNTRKKLYKFRKGPVPNIFKPYKFGKYYRRPRTTRERKISADPDIQAFIRPKRRSQNLVNYWDDIPRHIDKCWKNKKIERQWMKNLK
nr:MAG: hypothetical protein DIU64_12235 [Caldicoprobacter oshimai]